MNTNHATFELSVFVMLDVMDMYSNPLKVSLLSLSILLALSSTNVLAAKLTVEQRLELLENQLSENQTELRKHLDEVILPKKGRLNQTEKERETNSEFIKRRHQHSAVESAINALEVHGLDKCPDHGIQGFKRYVSLAVLARNIQRLGAVIRGQEIERENRKRGSYKKAA